MNLHLTYAKALSKAFKKDYEITPPDSVVAAISRIERSTIQRYWTQGVTKQTIFMGKITDKNFVIRKRLVSNWDFGYTIFGEFSNENIQFKIVPGTISSVVMPIIGLIIFNIIFGYGRFTSDATSIAIMCTAVLMYYTIGIYRFVKYSDTDLTAVILDSNESNK